MIAIKANLAKAKDAKLWVFQIMLMIAKLPNSMTFSRYPYDYGSGFYCFLY